MSNTQIEAVLETKGHKFLFSAKLHPDTAITMKVMTIDQTERWTGEFAPSFLEDLTSKAGSLKKAPVFWKMLTTASLKMSKSVRLEVILPEDLDWSGSDEVIGVLLTHSGEFDKIRYHLQLTKQPFTTDELILTARKFAAEIARLKERCSKLQSERSTDVLESRIADLTAMIDSVQQEKQLEVAKLKRKLRKLEARSDADERSLRSPSNMSPTGSPNGSPIFDGLNAIGRSRMRLKQETPKKR